MRRTKVLTLALVGTLVGCGPNVSREAEVQRCIDSTGRMADEQNCRQLPRGSGGGGGYIGYRPMYRWVYGGNGGYQPGSYVSGFNESPTPGLDHVNAASLAARGYSAGGARVGITNSGGFAAPGARGGFGATGEGGHGGGGE